MSPDREPKQDNGGVRISIPTIAELIDSARENAVLNKKDVT